VEVEMDFLGLLVMENRLKVETTPVISELNRANLRTGEIMFPVSCYYVIHTIY